MNRFGRCLPVSEPSIFVSIEVEGTISTPSAIVSFSQLFLPMIRTYASCDATTRCGFSNTPLSKVCLLAGLFGWLV